MDEIKTIAKMVEGALTDIVKAEIDKAYEDGNLNSWLFGETPDGISNVEKVLKLISTNHSVKWNDYLSDNYIKLEELRPQDLPENLYDDVVKDYLENHTTVTKDQVVQYLKLNNEEVADILDDADVGDRDLSYELTENVVDAWFTDSNNSDIVDKVSSNCDVRDIIKDLVDEL